MANDETVFSSQGFGGYGRQVEIAEGNSDVFWPRQARYVLLGNLEEVGVAFVQWVK